MFRLVHVQEDLARMICLHSCARLLSGCRHPLGRTIGGTIYLGLMATAASFYWILHALHINIRNV